MRLPVVLRLPDGVRDVREPVEQELADSHVERRWIDAGPGRLAGRRIELVGLQLTITDVLVRIEMLDGRSSTAIVRAAQPWVEIAASQSAWGWRPRTRGRASGTSSSAPTTCCSCWACC